MSLTISVVPTTALLPEEIPYIVTTSLERTGVATLLCRSYDQAESALKHYAKVSEQQLGVRAEGLASWVEERWSLYGDGRQLVSGHLREALAYLTLHQTQEEKLAPLALSKGTYRMASKLAREASGMIALTPGFTPDFDAMAAASLEIQEAEVKDGKRKPEDVGFDLTPGEARMLELYGRYERLLAEKNLIEPTRAMLELPGALAKVELGSITFWDFNDMSAAERKFVCELARDHEVHVIVRGSLNKAGDATRALVVALLEDAEYYHLKGARLRTHPTLRSKKFRPENLEAYANPERNATLEALLGSIFSDSVEPLTEETNNIALLEAAGPFAEAELLAKHCRASADAGLASIVVATPDVRRMWRELSPKLSARGLEVKSVLIDPVLELESVRSFMGFAKTVATLVELDWPQPIETPAGTYTPLGSMAWWPPDGITDFLMSDISGVSREAAWSIDKRWRTDRLLTPKKVLANLEQASMTSAVCADACRQLRMGRIGAAAMRLADVFAKAHSFDGEARAWEEAQVAGLSLIAEISRDMGRAGLTCALSKHAKEDALSLSEWLQCIWELAEVSSVVSHPVRKGFNSDEQETVNADQVPTCEVSILSYSAAAQLDPTSVDELILSGMTTGEMGVESPDDAYAILAEKLMIEQRITPLARVRQQIFAALCASREQLGFERALNNRDSKETYPSVVLTEIERVFARDTLKKETLGESAIAQNLSASGHDAEAFSTQTIEPTGKVSKTIRPYILLPKFGDICLSASQIEAYLECPYNWFSGRRLSLRGIDADFGGKEKGTFVHRVLELTHKRLLCEAAGIEPSEDTPTLADPRMRLDGSRVTLKNLEHAQKVLDEVFDECMARQMMGSDKHQTQPLIAHRSSQEFQLRSIKKNLLLLMGYEAKILEGFEPRYFELRFGGKDGASVKYAGVNFEGSIDRVDVDSEGRSVIIDYKYKPKIFNLYSIAEEGEELPRILPRHVQSIIYAQVLRRSLEKLGLDSVGAVYLGCQPDFQLSGAVPESLIERVWGSMPRNSGHVTCGRNVQQFHDYLDACEEAIQKVIESMRAGEIDANPIDANSCKYCPVHNCEKRLG